MNVFGRITIKQIKNLILIPDFQLRKLHLKKVTNKMLMQIVIFGIFIAKREKSD